MMSPLFDPELSRQISTCGIVAVLILDRVKDAVPVAQSLVTGGVTAMELTLRTRLRWKPWKRFAPRSPT